MKFNQIIKKVFTPARIEKPLSRIYGYQNTTQEGLVIVPDEARVISTVIQQLATKSFEPVEGTLNSLLKQFNTEGIRNRSGKRWTKQTIIGLVRPVYAGIAVSPHGVWRRSKIYPAIVSVDSIKQAIRRLKTEKVVETALL